jgi:predicted nucleic acid-binding protein
MNEVIDANVYVSALVPPDVYHAASYDFLAVRTATGDPIFCPTLAVVETAAAIARPTGNETLARLAANRLESLTGVRIVSLDLVLAGRAADLAVSHRLRGADAVYVAVAEEFGARLITWDYELLERGAAAVPTLTPADWLIEHRNRP